MTRRTRSTHVDELHSRWKTCEFAPMWRQVHNLTQKFSGPHHKKYNVHNRNSPDKAEWEEHVTKAATVGGMTASTIPDVDEFLRITTEGPLPEMDHNHVIMARQAVKKIRWLLRKSPRRKSCPPWSLPMELLLMIFTPMFRSGTKIGHEIVLPSNMDIAFSAAQFQDNGQPIATPPHHINGIDPTSHINDIPPQNNACRTPNSGGVDTRPCINNLDNPEVDDQSFHSCISDDDFLDPKRACIS
jgi:hypothetical protein